MTAPETPTPADGQDVHGWPLSGAPTEDTSANGPAMDISTPDYALEFLVVAAAAIDAAEATRCESILKAALSSSSLQIAELTREGDAEPVAWRWRYERRDGKVHWTVCQTPRAAYPASPGLCAVIVEPLYAAPPSAEVTATKVSTLTAERDEAREKQATAEMLYRSRVAKTDSLLRFVADFEAGAGPLLLMAVTVDAFSDTSCVHTKASDVPEAMVPALLDKAVAAIVAERDGFTKCPHHVAALVARSPLTEVKS